MRIVIGSDHGGYALKQEVVAGLRRDGHDVLDVGTDSLEERHARRLVKVTAIEQRYSKALA